MCKNKVEDKCCGKECESKIAAKQKTVFFNKKLMELATASEVIMEQQRLTKEERLQVIPNKAKDFN